LDHIINYTITDEIFKNIKNRFYTDDILLLRELISYKLVLEMVSEKINAPGLKEVTEQYSSESKTTLRLLELYDCEVCKNELGNISKQNVEKAKDFASRTNIEDWDLFEIKEMLLCTN
jgi:hypothetical protein